MNNNNDNISNELEIEIQNLSLVKSIDFQKVGEHIANIKFNNNNDDNIIDNDNISIKKYYEYISNHKKIIEIIKEFDLPILIDDFFKPIGKKDEINFNDFCSLFRPNNTQTNDIFFQTFASSFHNSKVSIVPPEEAKTFPVQVIPK